jgi:hypothetical protein
MYWKRSTSTDAESIQWMSSTTGTVGSLRSESYTASQTSIADPWRAADVRCEGGPIWANASRNGPSGLGVVNGSQPPRTTRTPVACSQAAATSVDLPAPGSPAIVTPDPERATAPANARASRASSRSRSRTRTMR